MGRKAHKPDLTSRRQVEAMAGYGVPEVDIAKVLGVDPKTLRKHYREELDTGQIKASARVAEFLYRKATNEGPQSVTAAIFWLKTRAGWKETSVQEIESKQPTNMTIRWLQPGEVNRLSDEQLESIASGPAALAALPGPTSKREV